MEQNVFTHVNNDFVLLYKIGPWKGKCAPYDLKM